MKKSQPVPAKCSRYLVLPLLLAGPVLSPCYAESAQGEDPDLLTLIQLMETDIATKTDLQDPDKAPGLVTVLLGEELRARGYRTVKDALNHQAGFDITLDSRGILTPAVRGIGGIRSGASGKVKFMVNGTMTNSVRAGADEEGLAIPLNLVDKIEIIRGPGSAVHGEFAYAGVVNVVTRKGDTAISANLGADDSRGVDGLFTHTTDAGLTVDVLGSLQQADPDISTGLDALYAIGQGGVSYAPGKSNEYQDSELLFASLNYQNSEVRFHWSEQGFGDYFGLSSSLAQPGDDTRRDNTYWYVDGSHLLTVNDQVDLRLSAGYQFFRGDFNNIMVQPPGYSLTIPPIPFFGFPGMTVVYPDGILASTHYEEERYDAGATFTYRAGNHTVLAGAEYSRVDNPESTGSINMDLLNPNPLFAILPLPEIRQYPGSVSSLAEDQVREIVSGYVQDEYRPSARITLTAGARYDNYSDVQDSINPRLAVVYQLTEYHSLKAQYGSAFRPPTYAELFSAATTSLGNPNIEPETIDTYELGWIYKRPDAVVRTTLFRSELEDLIILAPTGFGTQGFANAGGATSQGLELETELTLSRQFRVDGNVTLLGTEDERSGAALEGSADVITNLILVYQPQADLSLNLSHRYVGKRHRSPVDSRDKLDDFQTVDFTANLFNLASPGVTLRAGLYNLFDEDVAYPAPVASYPDDFPRAGRTWLVELSKTFK